MKTPRVPPPNDPLPTVLAVALDAQGETVALDAGACHRFDDPGGVWFIRDGLLDLYAVQRRNNRQTGPRDHLGALGIGALIWGSAPSVHADGVHTLAVTSGGARLSRLPVAAVIQLGRAVLTARPLADALNAWLTLLLQGVADGVTPRRPPERAIAAGEEVTLEADERVTSHKGVVWVEPRDGTARWFDIAEVGTGGADRLLPLTPQSWLHATEGRALRGYGSEAMLSMEDPAGRMATVHALVVHLLAYGFRNGLAAERGRLERRARQTALGVDRTLAGFVGLVNRPGAIPLDGVGDDALLASCALVGRAAGLAIVAPLSARRRRAGEPPLDVDAIALASNLRARRVLLSPRWWREDGGAMIGFLKDGDHPVALLPRSATAYRLHDPTSGREQPVTAAVAGGLWPGAFVVYPSFPDHALTPYDLVSFVAKRCRRDLAAILATGALGGLIATGTPMAAAYVFDTVAPGHQSAQLLQVGLALVVAAFSAAAFHVTRDIAQLRVEGKIAGALQAAVMDRLLRLPNSFFADYATGDLAQRTLVIEVIRRTVTGVVLGALVTGVFSLFSLGLLFYYSPAVAAVAAGLALSLAAVTAVTGMRLLDATLRSEELAGTINSLVLEIITGIVKLRLAGAQDRAFAVWGRDVAAQRVAQLTARRALNGFAAFWSGFEILGLAAVFAAIAGLGGGGLSTGALLAFVAAFSGFFTAAHAMAQSVLSVFSVAPKYRRAAPILRALPETAVGKTEPGPLSGTFEVNSVAFRYSPNGPRVLNGLSITVKAGEFVALVGASGCGKSTLMRLLLGLVRPEAGGVYFDGKDLRGLNLQSVRRQIGVVLQNSRLTPGSLYDNIKGATRATLEDCWEAAAMTGLDHDIQAMPMAMHTMLTEGTATLSGGQIQRVLLARAIVGKPRLLLLDEATSALDNLTQAVVIESLDRLSMTRLVIAHRLSTIIRSDCIHVLSAGQIVESGGYDELIRQGGLFHDFHQRQTL